MVWEEERGVYDCVRERRGVCDGVRDREERRACVREGGRERGVFGDGGGGGEGKGSARCGVWCVWRDGGGSVCFTSVWEIQF